jgi:hypothetical protein
MGVPVRGRMVSECVPSKPISGISKGAADERAFAAAARSENGSEVSLTGPGREIVASPFSMDQLEQFDEVLREPENAHEKAAERAIDAGGLRLFRGMLQGVERAVLRDRWFH